MKSKIKCFTGLMMTGVAHAHAEPSYNPIINPIFALSSLTDGAGKALGIIMMLAFMFAVFKMISGGLAISKGDNEAGKQAIVGGLIIAGATTIVKMLFGFFGLSGAEVRPSFNN